MEKVTDIIESIANEKGLEESEVRERVMLAFIQTAKQLFGEEYNYDHLGKCPNQSLGIRWR